MTIKSSQLRIPLQHIPQQRQSLHRKLDHIPLPIPSQPSRELPRIRPILRSLHLISISLLSLAHSSGSPDKRNPLTTAKATYPLPPVSNNTGREAEELTVSYSAYAHHSAPPSLIPRAYKCSRASLLRCSRARRRFQSWGRGSRQCWLLSSRLCCVSTSIHLSRGEDTECNARFQRVELPRLVTWWSFERERRAN